MTTYLGQQLHSGEKGHVEYTWSEHIQKKIVQLNFQLTRTDSNENQLKNIFYELLSYLKNNNTSTNLFYLTILYQLTAYTRDIIFGKGECRLTYMLIYGWYDFFPELAFNMMKHLVYKDNEHPLGSWKDIKYFYKYCLLSGVDTSHPLLKHCVFLINSQLMNDISSDNPSLLAKWIPREKSSFGRMFEPLAVDFYKDYLVSAKTDSSRIRAVTKCKTHYRQLISSLNKRVETPQIYQCDNKWSMIDFAKVTSVTITKQKYAFMNQLKNGSQKHEFDDRKECALNFKSHIEKCIESKKEVNGKRNSMSDFTKSALSLLSSTVNMQLQTDLLNSQWRSNATQCNAVEKFIPMVDVSSSMDGIAMEVAIALGIRISEQSLLRNRVITFSQSPTWINLDGCDGFVDKVDVIRKMPCGMNTNFYAALDLILESIIESKLDHVAVSDLKLVILSDMQMDISDCELTFASLYDNIKHKYHEAGIHLHGKPFNPPHIVMWNLKSTNGFPSLSFQSNTTMISGFSTVLLNGFCEKGIEDLKEHTPWNNLINSLKKYEYLKEDVISSYLTQY